MNEAEARGITSQAFLGSCVQGQLGHEAPF